MFEHPPLGASVSASHVDQWAYRAARALRGSLEEAKRSLATLEGAARNVDDPYRSGAFHALLQLARGIVDDAGSDQRRKESRHGASRQRILQTLAEATTSQRPSTIADSIGVSRPHVNRLLRAMVKDGLVERSSDSDAIDGRGVRYSATPAGLEELVRLRRDREEDITDEVANEIRTRAAYAVLKRHRDERRVNGSDKVDPSRLEGVVKAAQRASNDRLFCDAIAEMATTLRQDGRPDEAKKEISRLSSRPGTSTKQDYYAHACELYQRARLADNGSPASRPLELLREAYNVLSQHDDLSPLSVWTTYALSVHHRRSGHNSDALSFALSAHREAKKLDADGYAVARTGIQAAFAYRLLGQAGDALHVLDLATGISREQGFAQLLAECQFHEGEARRYNNDLNPAYELLSEASARLDTFGADSARITGFAYSALGAAHYDMDNLSEAESCLQRALQIAKDHHAPDIEALTRRRLGLVLKAMGQMDSARDSVRAARDIYAHKAWGLIGKIECQIDLAALTTDARQPLRSAAESLRKLSEIEPPQGGIRVRVLDKWTLAKAKNLPSNPGADKEKHDVLANWASLKDMHLVPAATVSGGKSEMGKEPIRVASSG